MNSLLQFLAKQTCPFCLGPLLVCCLAATVMAQSNCVSLPTSYIVTDLGTLGGSGAAAFAINNSGAVTGESNIPASSDEHAFLWTQANGMQDLGTLGNFSTGTSVNNLGDVAGYSGLANGAVHAFLWTASGGIQDLGSLNGSTEFSHAYGIDDHDRVVGDSETPTSDSASVIWSGGMVRQLGVHQTQALAINGRFEVTTTNVRNAFFWTPTGGFHKLEGIPGSTSSIPLAINNFGMIAGYDGEGIAGLPIADVWNGNQITSIGTLGGRESDAYGVNDQCQVVGFSEAPDLVSFHAFIWTQASGIVDLNTLIPASSGWVLNEAYGINSTGQIVGAGTINRRGHAFLLTPM
jgi:probable HAF family extracellular repeat protein